MPPKKAIAGRSFVPPTLEETILFGTTLGSTRIEVVRGDARYFEADAIVNAANSALRGGGGIDGQIHAASGSALRDELERAYPNGGEVGGAYATGSHGMKNCEHIIHAVGPDYREATYEEDADRVLATTYDNSLREAGRVGATTIAFPTISTGIFQAPRGKACRIALETVRDYPEPLRNEFTRIVFLIFGNNSEDEEQYTEQFFDIFGEDEEDEVEEEKDEGEGEEVDYSKAGHVEPNKSRGISSKGKSKTGKSQPSEKPTKGRDTSSTSKSQAANAGSKRKRLSGEADQSTTHGADDQDDEDNNNKKKKKSSKDKKDGKDGKEEGKKGGKGGRGGVKKGGRPSEDPDEPPLKKQRCAARTRQNKRCKNTYMAIPGEQEFCHLHQA